MSSLTPKITSGLLAGTYVLGSKSRGGVPIRVGVLRLRRANAAATDRHGQWTLVLQPDDPKTLGPFRERVIGATSRLGITPVRFRQSFLTALRSEDPMCLVADTSALYHGVVEAALRVRANNPTHVAVPDQVLMELQRQRENSWGSPSNPPTEEIAPVKPLDEWMADTRRYPRRVAAARSLRRIRAAGHILHLARPPQPMVRYFGGSHDTPDVLERGEAGTDVGPNYLRDRLILEAVYEQRAELAGVPTWLLTADANFAAHADVEGFKVGFGWRTSSLDPPIVGSPFIDPHTLNLCHVPLAAFLEELLWNWHRVTIQRNGEASRIIWQLPGESGDNSRAHVLTELGEPGVEIRATVENCERLVLRGGAQEAASAHPPARLPPPHTFLKALLQLAEGPSSAEVRDRAADPFLRACGWSETSSGVEVASRRGIAVAKSWRSLSYSNTAATFHWFNDVRDDLLQIQSLGALASHLGQTQALGDAELAVKMGVSAKGTVQTQAVFANAFGLAVRVGGKTWLAKRATIGEAAVLVEKAIRERKASSESAAVSVERVFTYLLDHQALNFVTFRAAVSELRVAGKIGVGGTSPAAGSSNSVKLRALMPTDDGPEHNEVDLSRGASVVAGESVQVVWLEVKG